MSITDFKSEFSALLKRYASVTSPTDESSKGSSPTRNQQELLNAIRDTLCTALNVKLQFLEESSLKTPAHNEIVVATPHAPDVPRIIFNQSFESYKSFAENENGFRTLPNYNGLHTHQEEKVEVLDNDISVDNANNNNKDAKNDNLRMMAQKEAGGFHQKLTLTNSVEEAQQNVQKVMSILQRMAAILIPETRPEPHAVRRLSTILKTSAKKPALNQSLRNTIQRQQKARRSFAVATDDVVTTPTSSRPSHVMPQSTKMPVSKLAQHSISMSSTTGDKPKSPAKTLKNPKYAHVQSTIPKHTVVKKKT